MAFHGVSRLSAAAVLTFAAMLLRCGSAESGIEHAQCAIANSGSMLGSSMLALSKQIHTDAKAETNTKAKDGLAGVEAGAGPSLFCFSFYQQDTGSTQTDYALELLQANLKLGSSLFGCDAYRVYSDVLISLSGKVQTLMVEDIEGNFHFAKSKDKGTWINSNMFIAVWKKIQEESVWSTMDWTVKVDPYAVFFPTRLSSYLAALDVKDSRVYLETCKYAAFGFLGSLEVIGKTAFATVLESLDDCKNSLDYMGKEPLSEDRFLQSCMDLHGVDRVSAWDLATDATCESYNAAGGKWTLDCATAMTALIHPLEKPAEYFDCLTASGG